MKEDKGRTYLCSKVLSTPKESGWSFKDVESIRGRNKCLIFFHQLEELNPIKKWIHLSFGRQGRRDSHPFHILHLQHQPYFQPLQHYSHFSEPSQDLTQEKTMVNQIFQLVSVIRSCNWVSGYDISMEHSLGTLAI